MPQRGIACRIVGYCTDANRSYNLSPMEHVESTPEGTIAQGVLDFLWIELTSRCNLRCVHCYAESEPSPSSADVLTLPDFERILASGAQLGCKRVQFIGGEPTLFSGLARLIAMAHALGYSFIEVFTNATRISDTLLACFIANNVHVALSFYSHRATTHDRITKGNGSHAHTINSISRLLGAGVPVRAGIIVMPDNAEDVDETKEFLRSLGVKHIGFDRVRGFGRGTSLVSLGDEPNISELCGSCWRGSLCVSADGNVSPCIMSKKWSLGSIQHASLAEFARSPGLRTIRRRIYEELWVPRQRNHKASSDHSVENAFNSECSPDCSPTCSPSCGPTTCSPNCSPSDKCNPDLYCGPCYPDQ